jgi:hypothetical protein
MLFLGSENAYDSPQDAENSSSFEFFEQYQKSGNTFLSFFVQVTRDET